MDGLRPEPRAIVRLLTAVALIGAAVALQRRFSRTTSGPHTWAGPAVGLFGLSQLLMAVTLADPTWRLSASIIKLGAAAIAAVGACDDLVRSQTGQRERIYQTLVTSHAVAASADGEKALGRTRAHDLRTAVTAIQGASDVLERYADQLDDGQEDELRRAVSNQLGRLSHLIAHPDEDDLFAVADVVRSARRTAPRRVDLRIAPSVEELQVRGKPAPLAAVMATLLAAVPVTDPGTVELAMSSGTDRVYIDLRGRALGVTQWLTPGTLDLAAARTLLAGYGGDLVIDVEGGIRVTLPTTSSTLADRR